MKKFILVIVMTIESSKLCLAGVFTVTQYNLSIRPYSVTETKSYIAKESAWDGEPQTGTYTKVSFADLETNTDGNGNSCTPNFATVSFPGNIGGKHDWFAVEVKGFIKIPRPGWWSFACGSDDGFETTISGHGKSFTFAYDGHRWYATDVKPFYFEEAGVYKVQIVFFDYHINATLDFSMAEGYYTSFRSSIFHLAEAVDGVCTVSYNANCGTGTMEPQEFENSKEQKLAKNTYTKDGYVFQGWAESKVDADNGIVKFRDEAEIAIDRDKTLYAVWAANQIVVHFNANGGVFRGKDGNEVTQFDQCFTYGEAQRLFTDELTPMKMDENGNQFLGWVRGTPNVYSDSDINDGRKEETFYTYDGTETTYYAVWTTTVTVSFYNDTDVDSGRRILSPNSLGNHLSWSVDADVRRYKNGESVQVLPGQRIIRLYVDDEYHWIAGRFDLGEDNPYFHRAYDYLELNIGNDFRDALAYGSTPREYVHQIYVKVEPDISQPETHGDVVFFYEAAVREELRGLINAQRGNVPAFDISKVRISIGKTAVNQAGNVVEDLTHGLTGLELRKYYCLPIGLYYLKDVAYDADTSSGDPYWGAVLDSTFENLLFEVKDSRITERTINFDVFGGHAAVRMVFDPQRGECAKSEMWLLYHGTPYSNSGWISIDKKTAESLPTPEKREDFKFLGWFTERSGGLELKSGANISGDKVHWILPFEHTFYAYAQWTDMKDYWLLLYPKLAALSGGDIVTAAKMPAANGCRTVGECYALGIDPEDPNDDLRIAAFKMVDGKPVIKLNHTEDGSGNSLLPRVKTLGKADPADPTEEWREVPEDGDPTMRFFTVGVEMP